MHGHERARCGFPKHMGMVTSVRVGVAIGVRVVVGVERDGRATDEPSPSRLPCAYTVCRLLEMTAIDSVWPWWDSVPLI